MHKKLKQRIVGLFVLGALTAIIVPVLLDISQSNQEYTDVSVIPAKPDDFIVKRLFLDGSSHNETDTDSRSLAEKRDTPVTGKSTDVKQDSSTRVPLEASDLPTEVAEIKKDLEKPAPWVIQLASFSSEKNALALRNKLQKSGYSAFVERVDIDGKNKVRVKVGPVRSKKIAKELQADLMTEFQLEGVIVRHRAGTAVITARG